MNHPVNWRVRIGLACLASLACLPQLPAQPVDAKQEAKLYGNVLKSCVWIVLPIPSKPGTLVFDEGSGYVVDARQRLVLTNYHVVGKKTDVLVIFPQYAGGKLVKERNAHMPLIAKRTGTPGKVLAVDAQRDLALIQLAALPKGTPGLPFAAEATKGERVYNLGNPGEADLWQFTASIVLKVESFKAVSKKGELELMLDMTMVETDDATAKQGQSGSVLVNARGQVVGVLQGNSQKDPKTTLFVALEEVRAFLTANPVKEK